jgi:hypothetical protein
MISSVIPSLKYSFGEGQHGDRLSLNSLRNGRRCARWRGSGFGSGRLCAPHASGRDLEGPCEYQSDRKTEDREDNE